MPYGFYPQPLLGPALGDLSYWNSRNQDAALANNSLLAGYYTNRDAGQSAAREQARGQIGAARQNARGAIGAAEQAGFYGAIPSLAEYNLRSMDFYTNGNTLEREQLNVARDLGQQKINALLQALTGLQGTIGNIFGGIGPALGGAIGGIANRGSQFGTPATVDPYSQHANLVNLIRQIRGVS